MSTLDSRLHAFRTDLADSRLKGRVEAARFADGELRQIRSPLAGVHREPRSDSMQVTQALLGERCRVFDLHEGWAWVQLEADGYVGYIAEEALSAQVMEPTHHVAVPSTFIYPGPNLKTQPVTVITLNAGVAATGNEGKFAKLSNGGFVIAEHLKPAHNRQGDFVTIAEMFHHVPYLWGGKSVIGLDCSGLVQLSLEAVGIACPRDTDMQERALGARLRVNALDTLRRGDLVFWKGHVGIMINNADILHANGYHMLTALEPLEDAVVRIKASDGEIIAIKRL